MVCIGVRSLLLARIHGWISHSQPESAMTRAQTQVLLMASPLPIELSHYLDTDSPNPCSHQALDIRVAKLGE